MKVYALAAGYATRLHPLTLDRAKPLLEVAGAPILSHILGRVLPLPDLSEIIVIGNHRFHADLSAWAETFRAAHQAPPLQVLDDGSNDDDHKLGAIGDIAFGLQAVPPGGEDILVVAGDNLLAFDLRPLRQAFVEQGRRPTLVLRDVPVSHEPTRYNEVTLEPDGRVSRFREKPPEALTASLPSRSTSSPPRSTRSSRSISRLAETPMPRDTSSRGWWNRSKSVPFSSKERGSTLAASRPSKMRGAASRATSPDGSTL